MDDQRLTLYQRVLGDSFALLHPTLRDFHGATEGAQGAGSMRVERGRGWFRNLLATLMGFPPAAESVTVQLKVDVLGEQERWSRWFAAHPLHSLQRRFNGLLIEKAGPVSLGLQVSVDGENLRMERVRLWFLGLPLPGFLAPHVLATTKADERGWYIETTIQMPVVGLLVRYSGYMAKTD